MMVPLVICFLSLLLPLGIIGQGLEDGTLGSEYDATYSPESGPVSFEHDGTLYSVSPELLDIVVDYATDHPEEPNTVSTEYQITRDHPEDANTIASEYEMTSDHPEDSNTVVTAYQTTTGDLNTSTEEYETTTNLIDDLDNLVAEFHTTTGHPETDTTDSEYTSENEPTTTDPPWRPYPRDVYPHFRAAIKTIASREFRISAVFDFFNRPSPKRAFLDGIFYTESRKLPAKPVYEVGPEDNYDPNECGKARLSKPYRVVAPVDEHGEAISTDTQMEDFLIERGWVRTDTTTEQTVGLDQQVYHVALEDGDGHSDIDEQVYHVLTEDDQIAHSDHESDSSESEEDREMSTEDDHSNMLNTITEDEPEHLGSTTEEDESTLSALEDRVGYLFEELSEESIDRTGDLEEAPCDQGCGKPPLQVGSIRGIPGINFPDYEDIPITSFTCADKKFIPGFYADLETGCQVFHACWPHRRESFLCPIGTTFNQAILACDYWYSTNCSLAPLFFDVNAFPTKEAPTPGSMVDEIIKVSTASPCRPVTVPQPAAYPSTTANPCSVPKSTPPYYEPTPTVISDYDWTRIAKFLPVKSKITLYPESKDQIKKPQSQAPEDKAIKDLMKLAESVAQEAKKFIASLKVGKLEPVKPKVKLVPQLKKKPVWVQPQAPEAPFQSIPAIDPRFVVKQAMVKPIRLPLKPNKSPMAHTTKVKDLRIPEVILRVLEHTERVVLPDILPLTKKALIKSHVLSKTKH